MLRTRTIETVIVDAVCDGCETVYEGVDPDGLFVTETDILLELIEDACWDYSADGELHLCDRCGGRLYQLLDMLAGVA